MKGTLSVTILATEAEEKYDKTFLAIGLLTSAAGGA